MNYFRCTVGGSGGKWKLTVTCTNVYAGLTITCTDGTTTLTKTCPSSSPYTVVFNIPNGGTWTISGTASGQTGTTTVIIPDSAILNPPIPTGSTVTPVNDIQIWLHCANIWDKTYTTINQVLADTSTLLALISSNNAADYMARSTNWASSVCANQTAMGYIGNNNYCANKLLSNSTWRTAICNSTYFESVLNVKVPTMTSATNPSGVVTQSSNYSGYDGYKAFNSDADGWLPNGGSFGSEWVAYQFTASMKLYKIKMYQLAADGTSFTVTYKVQGSNNGSTWSDIKDSIVVNTNTDTYTLVNPSTNYKYYRSIMMASSIGGTTGGMGLKLQFYGRA